jgi:hypothetical protein
VAVPRSALNWTLLDWDSLTNVESVKLQYILAVSRSLDTLNPDYTQFEFNATLETGTRSQRRINWQDIVRHCAPQVIVVMITDGVKESSHFDFPGYAILPRLERVVDLSHAVPSGESGRSNRDVIAESLSHLRYVVSSLEGEKKDRILKHLSILERMLRAAV